jgi:hypothetical protein
VVTKKNVFVKATRYNRAAASAKLAKPIHRANTLLFTSIETKCIKIHRTTIRKKLLTIFKKNGGMKPFSKTGRN